MSKATSYRHHTRALALLALPLVGSHLAQLAITLTDAAMLGWYSVEALAGEILGGTLFYVVFIVGSGFAFAIMPLVAAAAEIDDQTQVRRITRMGAWASILFGLAVIPPMVWSESLFLALGQDARIAALAQDYLAILAWAVMPSLLVMVLKSYLAALERTQVILWVTVAALVLNIFVNYVLVFGNFGFPEMGIRGAALASLIVNVASFVVLAIYIARVLPEHSLFQRLWRPDWEALGQVSRLGWPIGLTNLAEVSLFAASTTMMGWLGKIPLAAHGIALQAASVAFMIHLGLSNAATVRISQAYSRADRISMRTIAKSAMAITALVAVTASTLFIVFPEAILGVFMHPNEPDRAAVITVGVVLLAAAALFQMIDGLQVLALGFLRGIQDTKVPMVIAVFSYWIIGVSASYYLGFVIGMEGLGVWLGLAIGLAVAAVLLLARYWQITTSSEQDT
ncbi:Multidrug resistance protein MdtK [Roseovarius albus]|uniref:Multidrug-efflux transporter n=1 Tax=Roseovarius albus TaxID=1247867 RepID=A0A1X6Z3T8_9RHOB|nr:MATE family efflux transporter [Roseovarius albus]SLN39677.1 Multidrug resistance protein MdtK [Roseovarius albus]